MQKDIWNNQRDIERFREELIQSESALAQQNQKTVENPGYEQEFQEYLAGKKSSNYEYLKRQRIAERYPKQEREEQAYQETGGHPGRIPEELSEPYLLRGNQE